MDKPGCILIVEDEGPLRAVLAEALRHEGCEVLEAADRAAALALLDGASPDVILLDMRMPVLDGWAFAAAHRARPGRRAPVVVMTAAQHAAEWAAEIGADASVPKPFELPHFLAALGQFTDCVKAA